LITSVLRRGNAAMEAVERGPEEDRTVTEWLALSYARQSQARLESALDAAIAAAERAPDFGFALVRQAELAFSLGRIVPASRLLDRGLVQMPEHAAAHVLRGFLHAAGNRIGLAREAFERALTLDPSLGDAWLGRGLAKIRSGDLEGGRTDLIVAAAAESQRSVLRSYLAKAYADSRVWVTPADQDKARHEFELAKALDPRDPTPWLYSALFNQQGNRVNEAIDDLRESVVRNDNRALYRSPVGLDQDRAVRSANLANLFADAGFQDFGVREATRAVNDDYANASAHLFLANSYDALRDPRQINLRYETPWYSEYLLGNLLAPVGAGSLSQTVAQNEYSKLFERDRLGWVNRTTWTSNGDWIQQATQFGQFGNVAYSLDGYYRSDQGQRANNQLEQRAVFVTAKIQVGVRDGLFLQAGVSDAESGDVLQRYDPETAIQGMRLEERQEPVAHLGWNHEWRPGMNTVVLVSPWNVTQTLVNPSNAVPWVFLYPDGTVETGQFNIIPMEDYRSRLTGVAVEVQQLWKADRHTVVAGARYQHGGFDTQARLNVDDFVTGAPAHSTTDPKMERASVYAYDHWSLFRGALLTMGVSYDRLTQPRNFRTAPLTEGTDTKEQVLPKVGLTVTPWKGGTVRAAWARTLGGVSFDQSFRLEPVQVAGFTQVYRGLMPESLVGSVAGQEMETIGMAWDQLFPTRTWLTVSAERLSSEASREIGGYVLDQFGFEALSAFRQELAFTEHSVAMTVGQLVGRDWALTMRYRVAEAELDGVFPGLPADEDFVRNERSVLNQVTFGARYQRPEGFFASWESAWTHQSNSRDAAEMTVDDFWRHDLWVGWRFLRRQAELAVGVLNLTDEDYRLYPLNYFGETYRERTVAVTGRFAF
jgi:tetratricopeptide (TPR) repeat protein